MYDKLLEYKKEHGDCLVPINYPKLGPWVERQRYHFRHMEEGTTSVLDEARKEALRKIEFVWEGENDLFFYILDFCTYSCLYLSIPKHILFDGRHALKNSHAIKKNLDTVTFRKWIQIIATYGCGCLSSDGHIQRGRRANPILSQTRG
jgi:hypothetical protein